MATREELLGTDLRLLRDLARRHSNRDGGHDLSTVTRPSRGGTDLDTVAGADNLVQALVLRLLTPVGELAPLGHPDYGSRLATLVGERNTETVRNRAKLFVLQALQAEPRVKQVLSVRVTQAARDRVDIHVTLRAIDGPSPLNLVVPFSLAGGAA